MAKGWKALTNIEHGKEDGSKVHFAPGDVVEGLSKEAMKDLWEAGALEQFETTDEKKADESTSTERTSASTPPADSSSKATTSDSSPGAGTEGTSS